MIPDEISARTQPPDRPSDGLKAQSEGNERGVTQEEEYSSDVREKLQRKEGEFSGAVSLLPREEEWMDAEGDKQNSTPRSLLTYRDAVKPKKRQETEHKISEEVEEAWDGNLLLNDADKLAEGVSVTDTERGPNIEFSEEERKRLEKCWQNSLIIKLLGGTMGFMPLRRKLQAMWGKGGTVDLSVIGNGYMIATFQQTEDYYFALEGGPWLIQNHYLTVQTWKRNFNPWNETIKRVAIWVRLPGLPGDYYDKKFFFHLGNRIGKAIKVDEMTLTRARTMYARMCVEVDLNKPLLPSYSVDGNSLKIEYEGLHRICFYCGRFGHDAEHCPLKRVGQEHVIQVEEVGEARTNPGKAPAIPPERTYGGWMLAQEPKRGRRLSTKEGRSDKPQQKATKVDKRIEVASRFAVLDTEEESREEGGEEGTERRPLQNISNVNTDKREKAREIDKLRNQEGGKEQRNQSKGTKGKTINDNGKKKEIKQQVHKVTSREQDTPQLVGKVKESQTRDMGGPQKNKEEQVQVGQTMELNVGPKVSIYMDQGSDLERQVEKPVEKNEKGHNTTQGMATEEHIMDHFLDSLPEKVAETMDLAEGEPPDPYNPVCGMGLAAVERLVKMPEQGEEEAESSWLNSHERRRDRSPERRYI